LPATGCIGRHSPLTPRGPPGRRRCHGPAAQRPGLETSQGAAPGHQPAIGAGPASGPAACCQGHKRLRSGSSNAMRWLPPLKRGRGLSRSTACAPGLGSPTA